MGKILPGYKIVLILLACFSVVGCSKSSGTSTGNPFVSLSFAPFNSSLSSSRSEQLKTAEVGTLALSDVKFCFKRLRFKQDDASGEDNLDFELGEVTIDANGTTLAEVAVPEGTYSRIEFDLENECASGKSISLTNSSGSFSTSDSITIRFEGTFIHAGGSAALDLHIQQIMTSLNTVTSNSQLATKAEAASGTF